MKPAANKSICGNGYATHLTHILTVVQKKTILNLSNK